MAKYTLVDEKTSLFKIQGDYRFSPGWRGTFALLFPVVALVQFFYVDPLWLAIVVAVLLLAVAFVGWSAFYEYQFDTIERKYRVALRLPFGEYGDWIKITRLDCQNITFQEYQQEFTFHFLNLYKTHVDEKVFSLRLMNADGSYRTLAETVHFESVPAMLGLGRKLGEIYNVQFVDLVKDLVRRGRA